MSRQSEDPRRVWPRKADPKKLFPDAFGPEDGANGPSNGFTARQIEAAGLEVQQPCREEYRYTSVFPKRVQHRNHDLLAWEYQVANHNVLGAALGAFHGFLAAAGLPGMESRHPLTREGNFHVSLPMNVKLDAKDMELPLAVIDRLIDGAANHVILDKCMCRSGRHCKHHDPTIGCLFLGDTGLDVVPEYSRQVSAREAKQHVRRGIADGLVPMTCRTKIDNIAFQLKDRHTLLGICLCCDCCCYMAHFRSISAKQLNAIYPRLPGIRRELNVDACKGCGTCKSACYMDCIDVSSGKAVASDKCRVCGRCETACPEGAVTIRLTDDSYVDLTVEKFLQIADLSEKRPQLDDPDPNLFVVRDGLARG